MRFALIALLMAAAAPGPAFAQAVQQQFVFGGGAMNVQIAPDQKIMFEAAGKFVNREYREAESLYSQAISMNGRNIEAYLQRGAVRRELGETTGMTSDAQTAIGLANAALRDTPQNPTLYYQRGMGFRLLKQFDQARSDIVMGMQLGGHPGWRTDLQAVELERKTAAAR